MRALSNARVLLVGNLPPPQGGIAVHLAAVRSRLAEQGARVQVLDVGPGQGGPRRPWRRAPSLAVRLGVAALKSDLVHAHISGHTPRSWLVALGSALAGRIRGAALLTVHSGLVPAYFAADPQRRRLVRRVGNACDRVLAVSAPVAHALMEAGVAPERIQVAAAFTGEVVPGPAPAELDGLRAAHEPLLACAVADSPVYGVRLLLAALPLLARRHPAIGVALFGPARPHALLAEAARRGVAQRVHYLGELDRGQALAVVQAADLFVRPTLADGDSLAVREARALGRRVVASAAGARPPGCELFPVGDAAELARAVERALLRPAPQALGASGDVQAVLAAYAALLRHRAGRWPVAPARFRLAH